MTKPDKIIISGLEVQCIIGILEEERHKKQTVIIDIELLSDLSIASKTDNIKDTVDYFVLYESVMKMVESSHFLLLEKLAQSVADLCLEQDLVTSVSVRASKPEALKSAKNVSVVIERSKI